MTTWTQITNATDTFVDAEATYWDTAIWDASRWDYSYVPASDFGAVSQPSTSWTDV